jgi:hypothetical protein
MAKQMVPKDIALSITKIYDLSKPAEAIQMATVLKNIVIQQNLYVNIRGRNYAVVEAWQLAGFLTGMNVMVEEPKNLSNDKEIKYSVTAKVYQGDKIVSAGYALCSSKEVIKKNFEEYAILSMAQTRAIGKAYRNKIGWIMKLAGYEAVSGEEMQKVGDAPATPIELVAGINVCSRCGISINEQVANYSKKIYGKYLCRNCQKAVKK